MNTAEDAATVDSDATNLMESDDELLRSDFQDDSYSISTKRKRTPHSTENKRKPERPRRQSIAWESPGAAGLPQTSNKKARCTKTRVRAGSNSNESSSTPAKRGRPRKVIDPNPTPEMESRQLLEKVLRVGDAVYAPFCGNNSFYWGKIMKKRISYQTPPFANESNQKDLIRIVYDIRFEDGDEQLGILADSLMRLPFYLYHADKGWLHETPRPPMKYLLELSAHWTRDLSMTKIQPKPFTKVPPLETTQLVDKFLKPGDAVYALFKETQSYYWGRVQNKYMVREKHLYDIEFSDGDEQTGLLASEVMRLTFYLYHDTLGWFKESPLPPKLYITQFLESMA